MKFATFLITVIGIIFAFFYNILLWGFVAMKYWIWFALPLFPELPELSFGHAVGLMTLAGLFKYKDLSSIKKEYKDEKIEIITFLVYPFIFLLFGWIIKLIFMG